jgi:hypothetical protein
MIYLMTLLVVYSKHIRFLLKKNHVATMRK